MDSKHYNVLFSFSLSATITFCIFFKWSIMYSPFLTCRYDSRNNILEWSIPLIDDSNRRSVFLGCLSFSAKLPVLWPTHPPFSQKIEPLSPFCTLCSGFRPTLVFSWGHRPSLFCLWGIKPIFVLYLYDYLYRGLRPISLLCLRPLDLPLFI